MPGAVRYRLHSLRTGAFLAVRSLTRGSLSVLLMTVMMMALVYAQLLFIPGLLQGAIDRVEAQFVDTSSASVQVTPASGQARIDDADALITDISSLAGVNAATYVTRVGSEVAYEARSISAPVVAIDPVTYAEVFTTPENLIEGRWLTVDDASGIVLGVGVAGAELTEVGSYRSSLQDVHAGDSVRVTFANGDHGDFTVVGIYRNRFVPSDAQAFITRSAGDAYVPPSAGAATAMYVQTPRGAEDAVASDISSLRASVSTQTWLDLRSLIDEQVSSFELIQSILRVVSLFVAAVTVLIVTYVDLVGKRRTIGIERAIGIRADAIVVSYLLKAIVFALIGVAAGVGLFLGVLVPVIDRHPFSFPTGDVRLAVSTSLFARNGVLLVVVATVSALLPTLRTIRTKILDAIWS